MKKFSEQEDNTRNVLGAHINQRWGQLYELEKEWGETALKYLLLTNSGGAIATLSFLGAAPDVVCLFGAKAALLLFLLGVILVGVTTAKTFHHMSRLFDRWKGDVERYYSDQITWGDLQSEDKRRAVPDKWDYVIPYGSFVCFICGCLTGGWSLIA